MRIFIILQKYPKRGSVVAPRIQNETYNFVWNEKLSHYACEVANNESANRFLLGCHALRMAYIPGVFVTDEKPVKATEKVQKAADAVTPSVQEEAKAEAPAEVKSPVEPNTETTKAESQAPAKGSGKKKGKKS